MKQKMNLKMVRFPKLLGDLTHSNQVMKMFAFCSLIVSVFCLILLFMVANKPPLVLTFAPDAKLLDKTSLPAIEDQVKAAVNHYIEKRYNWNPANVKQRLVEASKFIHPTSLNAYRKGVAEVERFSTEKMVSQKVYPEKFTVNEAKKAVLITGDRITSIHGIKAAGDLRLQLSFQFGERNKDNSWGIYISKEIETQ